MIRCIVLVLFVLTSMMARVSYAQVDVDLNIIANSPNTSLINQGVVVTVDLPGLQPGATGQVTVSDGEVFCIITLPENQCLYQPTTPGQKVLVATYSGDGQYNSAQSPPRLQAVYPDVYPRRVSIPNQFQRYELPRTLLNNPALLDMTPDGRFLVISRVGELFWHDRRLNLTELITVSPSGPNRYSPHTSASISNDGNTVAFTSVSDDLVAIDTNGFTDVFLWRRQDAAITKISQSYRGGESDDRSSNAVISGNGLFVAFESEANNLVEHDDNMATDIFVYDVMTDLIELVNKTSDGVQVTGFNRHPSISDDGQLVTFTAYSDGLIPEDNNENGDVVIANRTTRLLTLASLSTDDDLGNNDSIRGMISGDGNHIVFTSYADNLIANDTNNTGDIFVRDLQLSTTERVSVHSNGTESSGESRSATISSDGRFVVFSSRADNLVAVDTNDKNDVFLHDQMTGETIRVSLHSDMTEPNQHSSTGVINNAATEILFNSRANNLSDTPSFTYNNIYVRNLAAETTSLFNTENTGTEPNGYSGQYRVSMNADSIIYLGGSSNLVEEDNNIYADVYVHQPDSQTTHLVSLDSSQQQLVDFLSRPVITPNGQLVGFSRRIRGLHGIQDAFVRDLTTGETELVSVNSLGEPATHASTLLSIASDGQNVLFSSNADNLVPGDTARGGLFVHNRVTGETTLQSLDILAQRIDDPVTQGAMSGDGRFLLFATADNVLGFGSSDYHQLYRRDMFTGDIDLIAEKYYKDFDLPVPILVTAVISENGSIIAYTSNEPDLVDDDTNGHMDAFLFNTETGTLKRISLSTAGVQSDAPVFSPSMSADGRYIAFYSIATTLSEADSDEYNDVFVHDSHTGRTEWVSRTFLGQPANSDATGPVLSPDGLWITYSSAAEDLVPGDTNYLYDMFLTPNPLLQEDTSLSIIGPTPSLVTEGAVISIRVQLESSQSVPADGSVIVISDQGEMCIATPIMDTPDGVLHYDCALQVLSFGSHVLNAQFTGSVTHHSSVSLPVQVEVFQTLFSDGFEG